MMKREYAVDITEEPLTLGLSRSRGFILRSRGNNNAHAGKEYSVTREKEYPSHGEKIKKMKDWVLCSVPVYVWHHFERCQAVAFLLKTKYNLEPKA